MTLARIETHIWWAWIVTVLIGLGTVAGYVAVLAGLAVPFRPGPVLLVRAGFVLFLAWGIRRRSRAAILSTLTLFLWSRLDLVFRFPDVRVGLMAGVSLLLFGYVLIQGARAIFAFHRMKQIDAPSPDAA